MKLNEKFKEKKFKYLIFSSIAVVIIFLATIIGWGILTSEKELKLIVINTYSEKTNVLLSVYEGSKEHLIPLYEKFSPTLTYNESYAFHIKFDKSHKICAVQVQTYFYSVYVNGTGDPYAKYIYYFPENELFNLLAVIDTSGDNITIMKMQEPEYINKIDFP